MTEQQSTTHGYQFCQCQLYCHCNSTSNNYARRRLSWLCV